MTLRTRHTRGAGYVACLTGLRGFAVLIVLFAHSSNRGFFIIPYLDFTGVGRYGVFLFFVLSSYLLTRQLLHASKPHLSIAALRRYFIRRVMRIYPLYTIALLVYALALELGQVVIPVTGVDLINSLLLLDAKGVFWTIPVEFKYYMTLPVVVLAFTYLGTIVAICLAPVIIVTWGYLSAPSYGPDLLPFIPVFLLGSLAALLSVRGPWLTEYVSSSGAVCFRRLAAWLSLVFFWRHILLLRLAY